MSNTNLQKIIRAAMFTPTRTGWGLPILWWGKPGIGKSDIIEGAAEQVAFALEVLSPGERGEGGFGVTPMPDAEGYISYPPPRWAQQFIEAERGLLFLDEINTAAPALQAPMLGLLLKRRIGGAILPGGVRMMAAANDVSDSAGGWDLAPPMANRMGHLPWEAPSESEWTDWLMSNDSDRPRVVQSSELEAEVAKAWAGHWARIRGTVAGFIRAKPHALHKQPPNGSPEASRAWPSHRSWEFATRALTGAVCQGMSEADADMFAAAFVGSGVMSEFISYRREADLPDPTELLDGRIQWKPDFKRLDRTFAVMGSTTAIMMNDIKVGGGGPKALEKPAIGKRFTKWIELMTEVSNKAVDLCWGSARELARAGCHNHSPESKALMRKILPMLNATGGAS